MVCYNYKYNVKKVGISVANTKFKLTDETREIDGVAAYRIQALQDFGDVQAGELGGFIEREENLAYEENDLSWVYDNSAVIGDSRVMGNSTIDRDSSVKDSNVSDSKVRQSMVEGSTLNDTLLTKQAEVYDSSLDDVYAHHNSQIRNSQIENAEYEASYVQDATVSRDMNVEAVCTVQKGDDVKQMEFIDSAELGNYDETNIDEYVEKYEDKDAISLSDDDLSDLNNLDQGLQQ